MVTLQRDNEDICFIFIQIMALINSDYVKMSDHIHSSAPSHSLREKTEVHFIRLFMIQP